MDKETGTGAYMISGGANGSWVNLDNSLLLSSLAVTTSDAMSDVGETPWFSKELIAKYRLNQMAKAVGWLGLAATIVLVITNDSLSTMDKLFQISTNLLAFGLISYISLSAATLLPITIAFTISIFVTIVITTAVSYINSNSTARVRNRYFRDEKYLV